MEYRKFNDTIVIRMDRGEEILSSLEELAKKENIKLAHLEGLGAVNDFIVGVYDVESKVYHKKEYKGTFEIVSLIGNINTMDGKFYSHLHIACADEDNHVYGGHLNKAIISATLELFITLVDGRVDRFHDERTGLNLFDFVKKE